MIAIIDYGMGNLRSVQKGFEQVGHQATITADPAVLAAADQIVLPGVGAFRGRHAELRLRGLVEPVAGVAAGNHFSAFAWACSCSSRPATKGAGTRGWASARRSRVRFDCRRATKFRTWAGTN